MAGAKIFPHTALRSAQRLSFRLFFAIGTRRAIRVLRDAARAGGNFASVGKLYRRARAEVRAVFRPKSLHGDHVARLQRVLPPALPVNHVWRAALERPVHYLAVLALHVHIKIDVGIHEFHFGNGAGEGDGTILVEIYREAVMRENTVWRREHTQRRHYSRK